MKPPNMGFATPLLGAFTFGSRSSLTLNKNARFLFTRHGDTHSRRRMAAMQVRGKATRLSQELSKELDSAREECRPYRIDKSKLTNCEWAAIRHRSKAIPMIAETDPIDIIFEDSNFLVVNKPPFVKMHPAHRFEGGSLLNRAIGYLGFTPWLMHRLDMHTTGVVLMAKKKDLCKPIMLQFMHGEVRKEYLCVVDGWREESVGYSFVVDEPIQRHEVKYMREIGATKTDSKKSRTTFKILSKSERARMMVLQASPHTGRTHQIRLHAQARGLPIVGDDLYNPAEHDMYTTQQEINAAAQDERLLRYGRGNARRKILKLHAWKMYFRSPVDGEIVSFCASAPTHMEKIAEWAGMELPQENDESESGDVEHGMAR